MSDEKIPLARPAVGDAEAAALVRVLASGRLVSGPENVHFEAALAERCGRAHAVAVSSGTVALELALWALAVGPGDEVLVPAFGFPSAASAVLRCGGVPVAVELRVHRQHEAAVDRPARTVHEFDLIAADRETGRPKQLDERRRTSRAQVIAWIS